MANYKLVNADQLDADMKTVADKIREKSQLSDSLVWPDGFIDGVDQCSSLNFSVVGGTAQPSDPIENTIWINTDTEITSWAISPEQPSNPTSGMVWISNGSSSEFAFNALKKNEIKVYPLSAKQYVSKAWKDVDMNIYQDGAWGEASSGILYDSGNGYDAFTGGWVAVGLDADLEDDEGEWEYSSNAPTLTKNTSNMTVKQTSSGSGDLRSGIARTSNLINLSNYKTLNFTGKSSKKWFARLCVLPSNCTNFTDAVASVEIGTTSTTYTIDLSSISGSYYVAILVVADGSATSVTATINKVQLT